MPNAKILSEKQAIVEALAERMQKAEAGILVDYRGITVLQDTEMRADLRKNEVEYTVVKNTLTRIAADKLGMKELDPILNGTTALATSAVDPIVPFRLIHEYSKKMDSIFNVKAAFVEGQVISLDEANELAQLGSKDALYSKVLGTMIAPISSLAVCLNQILEQKGGSPVEAAAEEAPAEEAPAAE